MDHHRFDTLARTLAIGRSRRGSLALLGSLLAVPLVDAGAKKKKKTPCPPCKGRKKGKCKKILADGTACAGGTCQGGICRVSAPPTTTTTTTPPPGCPPQRVCGPGCCPEGQVCGSNGACVDPSCCSGDAICGPRTSVGHLCCVAPRHARCCCDSSPGSGDGYVHCCVGAECAIGCPSGLPAEGGTTTPAAGATVCPLAGDGVQSCPG